MLSQPALEALEVDQLTKEYPTRAEPVMVLRGVSLRLARGDALAIVGPSGCGKSTLLHILGTLERPTSGSVALDGIDPFELSEPKLAHFRNRLIGFVFQDHHLLPQCTTLENVLLPTIAHGRAAPESVERARSLLRRVGLERRLEHRPAELSGGERQRAAVARALIAKPTLLLADEPTGNLDRSASLGIAELLMEMRDEHQATLIVVTHSAEIAQRIGRSQMLDDGRLHE